MNITDDFVLKNIHEGYLVGGAVRDLLRGYETICDRDIAIKNAESFAKKIAEELQGTFIVLDSENHIYRVVLEDKKNYLDISEIRGNCIEEDLLERDFTINAIAYDLKKDEIIDVTGGLNDLKQGVLRHIKNENFKEDPLRILRAFRFGAVTGFSMTKELEDALKKYLNLAMLPAEERINYEIMKLFGGEYSSQMLLKMEKIGLLEKIFPYVKEMKLVPANSHHHLDLLNHSLETVHQIEIMYKNAPEGIKEHLDSIDFGGFPRINHLKLAGFLHDIGKFSTWTIESDSCKPLDCKSCTKDSRECRVRQRFIKHDDVGSKMVIPFMKKMKFSKKQIDYISLMIKNHIYPSSVISSPDLNEKIMMRYIRKMDENSIDNIILAKADRLSARGIEITEEIINSNISGLDKLLDFYLEKRKTLAPLPILLDGNEIMKLLDIKPSPELGKIMNSLHEAQLNGDLSTKEDAVNFILPYKHL